MSFRLPDDSLLPSTPNSRSLRSQPSTTPAGPPPSHLTTKSTTPGVPPPKSIFGSSYLPSNVAYTKHRGSGLKTFAVPQSSPPRPHNGIPEPDAEEDLDAEIDNTDLGYSSLELFARSNTFAGSTISSLRGLKRSRNGKIQPRRESNITAVAQGTIKQGKMTRISEPDELVIKTEDLLYKLDQDLTANNQPDALSTISEQLVQEWQNSYPPSTKEGGIGPDTDQDGAIAAYIASFAIVLHNPFAKQVVGNGRSLTRAKVEPPIPKALLDWLDVYHTPFPDDFDYIHSFQPAPSAHESFWDVVFGSLLRGKLDRTVALLQDAGWQHAITSLDDGSQQPGYVDHQLYNTREIVARTIAILQSCPAIRAGNWDVRSAEWSMFRQRVSIAISELETFSEGERGGDSQQGNMFTRSMQGSFSMSIASRKAESKVPWTIYENLKVLYGQLLGSVDEILLVSQDWLEASIYLTVWWDGEDGISSNKQRAREVDVAPLAAYQKRLGDVFALATTDPEDNVFSVDTMDPAQIGIACVMEDQITTMLEILHTLSLPISTAMADIALNDWTSQTTGQELLRQGFNNDDLMVLSHGPKSLALPRIDRDTWLFEYAEVLASKPLYQASKSGLVREGWELAASALYRLPSSQLSSEKLAELCRRIDINSDERADKVINLCLGMDLTSEAYSIAERYADQLAETTQRFGAILTYYARSTRTDKLRSTLRSLTTSSLIQSLAIPTQSSMDDQLVSLLAVDRHGLKELAASDAEAAQRLATELSGYATLRRFYDLRDQEYTTSSVKLQPLEQRREAANALLAIIASASDCIRGGLFDPDVESVVSVNGLLALIGEVLPLCGQKKWLLTQSHVYALLRVVEDYSACPARIRNSAAEVLDACYKAGLSDLPARLQKSASDISSTSGLTGSSYELLATSSMLLNIEKADSGAVTPQRAWDWRKGLRGLDASDNGAESLLLLLRVALAKELGKSWLG